MNVLLWHLDGKLPNLALMRLFFRRNTYNGEYTEAEHFDPDRWQRFVRRVARYLAFVDKRRAA